MPRKKYLLLELIEVGTSEDAIALLQICDKKALEEIITRKSYGIPFLARLVAYEYFSMQGRYKDAEGLLETLGRKGAKAFRRYHTALFGKRVCLNDCMINLFIEKASGIMPKDVLDKCIEILKVLGEKRTIYKSDLAAVMYFFSPLSEEDVAKIFEITDVSVRNACKRLSHKLAVELFNMVVDGYVSDEEKFAGWSVINSIANITKRDVRRLILGYNIPAERVKMFFKKSRKPRYH